MKITDYEILSHGCMYPDYFQGCGVYGTNFEYVQTGAGCSEKEAFDDALEQIYMEHSKITISADLKDEGEKASDDSSECMREDEEDSSECGNESYFYVSVRYNVE
jgi:hypothetical protein